MKMLKQIHPPNNRNTIQYLRKNSTIVLFSFFGTRILILFFLSLFFLATFLVNRPYDKRGNNSYNDKESQILFKKFYHLLILLLPSLPCAFSSSSPPRPFLNILVKQNVARLNINVQDTIIKIHPLSFIYFLLS